MQLRYRTCMRRRRIGGRYELREQLGASSWHATDTELERDVFVRVPAEELVMARLVHPAIVQVFDQGEDNGEPYVVYEYLSGGSLRQRLDSGALSEADAQGIAADITAALAYAHAQGVTHGALTPATILLDGEGAGKVSGFKGVATPQDDEHDLATILESMRAGAIDESDAEATAVLQTVRAASRRRRRPIAWSALAALVLLLGGVGAALLAASGESTSDSSTGSVSLLTSTDSTRRATQAPVVPPPATSEQTTEQRTAPSPTTEPPAGTSPPPTEPETTAPAATAEPPATTEPPPATTEPSPPATGEPPPTTEQPPPTSAVTETTG